MRVARSSRQTESRPPESRTRTSRRGSSRPVARTRSMRSAVSLALATGFASLRHLTRDEQLGRLGEALHRDLADLLEAQVRARRLDDGARDEHFAAGGPRGDPRREVDRAAVVVAVAVERGAG